MTANTVDHAAPTSMPVLFSYHRRSCAKTFRADSVEPYGHELRWIPSARAVTGLDSLQTTVEALAASQGCIVIHGAVDAEGAATDGVLRRAVGSPHGGGHFAPAARQWLPIDIDAVTVPDSVEQTDEAIIGWLMAALPEPVRGCSCIYQWTSSYLIDGNPRHLRVRIWCWMSGPVEAARLIAWAQASPVAVDDCIYRTVQPIYVNAPRFEGREDPVLIRVGRFNGQRDVVDAAGFPAPTAKATGSLTGGSDIDANPEQVAQVIAKVLAQSSKGGRHFHVLGAACELVGVGATVAEILPVLDQMLRAQGREPGPGELDRMLLFALAKLRDGTLHTETLPVSQVFPEAEAPTPPAINPEAEPDEPDVDPQPDVEYGKHGGVNAIRYYAAKFPRGGYCRWQQNDYLWTGTHYRQMGPEELESRVQRDAGLTPALVRQTVAALRSYHHCEQETAPFWIDGTGPEPTRLIVFRNGVLDLDAWLRDPRAPLLEHTPRLFTLAAIPVDYDEGATAPTFDRWLPSLFPGDAEQQREYVKMLGYAFLDSNPMQKLFVLQGAPRSGKGITQRLLTALVGAANVASTTLPLLGSQFGLANLIGKRLATIGEMNENKSGNISIAAVDALKAISGGDRIGIDRKNREIVEAALPVRFVLACNRMPAFIDPSGALADRMVLFHFTVSHKGREDYTLEGRLLAEASGIVNRALEGLRQVLLHGFEPAAAALRQLEDHRDNMSPARVFTRDCLVLGGQETVPCELLYHCYAQWATREGRGQMNRSNLETELKASGLVFEKGRAGSGDRPRIYRGFGLSAEGAALLPGGNAFG